MAANKNSKNGGEEAEQKKQTSMLTVLAVAAIFVIALLLWQGGMLPFAKKAAGDGAGNNTSTNLLADPSAKVLIQYMEKQSSMPSAFVMQFEQPSNELNISVRLEQNGALRQAIATNVLYSSRYIWATNQTIACEKSTGAEEVCATLNNTSALNRNAEQLEAMFPQGSTTGQLQIAVNKKLIEYGAFKFTSTPKDGRYANRSCKSISYILDYDQIDQKELQDIRQIEPDFSAPDSRFFRNFRLEQCMDDEFGVALHSRLSYDALTQSGAYTPVVGERIITAFERTTPEIAIPATQTALEDVETVAGRDQSMGVRAVSCRRLNDTNDSDTCLRQSAIEFQNIKFCTLASDDAAMGDCVVKMATQGSQVRPDLCSMAGPKMSECYANIAYIKMDISYCGLVTDADLKALCTKEVNGLIAKRGTDINTTIGNTTVIVHGASQR